MPPLAESHAPPAPPARSTSIWAGLLVAAVVLAYWGSLRVPFLFDDAGAVVNNPTIRRLDSLAVFNPPADGSTTTGRPLVNASFAVNFALSRENPSSYHALNLLLHAAAALVLFGLMRRTLEALDMRGPPVPSGPATTQRVQFKPPHVAFLTALLWALHPLQTETVVSVAQRTESLCGLLYLLTLYAFARGWRWLSVLACLAGMATKEVMATAPLAVLLYDRAFVAGAFGRAWRERRGYYAALAATWLLLAGLVWHAGAARGAAAGFGLGVSPWDYLLTQCRALVLYAKLAVWPHPLVLDYGTAVVHSVGEVWAQAVFVVAAIAGTLWVLVRRPRAGFLLAFPWLVLAPSSSVVPLVTQTIAEHRMYLPLAAIVALGVAGLYKIGLGERRAPARPGVPFALVACAVAFGALTAARVHDYRSAIAIWTDNVAKFPSGARGHNNLAEAWQAQGNLAAANAEYARAVALDPKYVTAHYDWGVALLQAGRVTDAISQLEAAVRLAPEHADAHVNLGNALVRAGRPAEAIPHYDAALRLHPAADAYFDRGVALLQLAQPEDAETAFRAALQLDPGLAEAHLQLGQLRLERHDLAGAGEEFRAAVRLRPNDAAARAKLGNLGNTLLLQNRAREAIACYEEMLRARPDDARTRENLELARAALR